DLLKVLPGHLRVRGLLDAIKVVVLRLDDVEVAVDREADIAGRVEVRGVNHRRAVRDGDVRQVTPTQLVVQIDRPPPADLFAIDGDPLAGFGDLAAEVEPPELGPVLAVP